VEVESAVLSYRAGRIAEAEDLFRHGFSQARASGCYPEMRPACVAWGDLCADLGRPEEAERHYRVAVEGECESGNLGGMVFDLQKLADCLLRQGRLDEAAETIEGAMELESEVLRQRKLAPDAIGWCRPDLHFCRGEYGEAVRLYREKVEFWTRAATRPDAIDLGRLQVRLAASEALLGRHQEAWESFVRAEETFAREWGPDHPKVAAARAVRTALLEQPAIASA
jgi:tetratricopeptide (TPR) repeat protein